MNVYWNTRRYGQIDCPSSVMKVVMSCSAGSQEPSSSTIDPWLSLMKHKHAPEAPTDLLNTALLNSAAGGTLSSLGADGLPLATSLTVLSGASSTSSNGDKLKGIQRPGILSTTTISANIKDKLVFDPAFIKSLNPVCV
ncbi:hypothetical protein INR49_022168 [Caranx melampygus]|nr:hypothetical protein INR49_022168 [Caranx melampygus]